MFKRLLLLVLCWAVAVPAAADSPVIWSGAGYAKNLTTHGFELSNGVQLNNDGAVNYVAQKAKKWTASGSVTVTDDTTAADLPRTTTGTGLKFTATGAGNAYLCFALDPADYNKKLAVSWDQNATAGVASTYVANDFQVDIYSTSSSTCASGLTRLALSTDSSAISGLPALTGTYRTTFDSPGSSTPYIKLQITQAANSHSIVLSNLYVGPGIVTQGAALSQWQSYAPTVGGAPSADVTQIYWRRVGESVQIQGYMHFTAAGTSTALTLSLPNGYTANTSVIGGSSTAAGLVGNATIWNGSAVGQYQPQAAGANSASIQFVSSSASTFQASSIASDYQLSFDVTVPVNELSGSGTVNVVQNDVEFAASTNGTWDAAATAGNTVYGPSGATISGALTAARTKVVQFSTPIQASDKIFLEYQIASTGQWVEANLSPYPFVNWPLAAFGAYFSAFPATNQATVSFQRYGTPGSTYNNATGSDWSSGNITAWRLRKVAGGQAVGFGAASSTASGLVSREISGTSWTPVLKIGSTIQSLSNQVGRYWRVGSIVYFSGRTTISGVKSGTGSVIITGLPFTSVNLAGVYAGVTFINYGGISAIATKGGAIYGEVDPNSSQIGVNITSSSGGTVSLVDSDLSSSSGAVDLLFSGWYGVN